jgi:prophage regulatory protein
MRLLSFPELKSKKGIRFSRVHIGRLVKAGKFPQPINIGDRNIAWVEEEVDDLIVARLAQRDDKAA